jgi:hypothetical protein
VLIASCIAGAAGLTWLRLISASHEADGVNAGKRLRESRDA